VPSCENGAVLTSGQTFPLKGKGGGGKAQASEGTEQSRQKNSLKKKGPSYGDELERRLFWRLVEKTDERRGERDEGKIKSLGGKKINVKKCEGGSAGRENFCNSRAK